MRTLAVMVLPGVIAISVSGSIISPIAGPIAVSVPGPIASPAAVLQSEPCAGIRCGCIIGCIRAC